MSPETKYDYSVIVPVYNSSDSLLELCSRIGNTLTGYDFELILVDDHSTDNSWAIIQQIETPFPIIKLQHLNNAGQAAACKTGIKQAAGRMIITIDDDLQFEPEQIADLIKAQLNSQADLIYGIAEKYRQPVWRKMGSRFAGLLGQKGSSFRLFSATIGKALLSHKPTSILLDLELRRYAQHIHRIRVTHHKRRYGKSNYSFFKLVRISFTSLLFYLGFRNIA